MADLGQSTDIPVHIGVWTNWSRGRIAGATITLSHQNGALLTAFLAMFITFVGTSFWRIISFTLHQLYSSDTPNDGLYHQTQAILRNSESSTTSLIRFIRVSWAWRTQRPLYRSMPLLTITACSMAAFGAASIFSAKVSSAMGNEVLVSSNTCGQFFMPDTNNMSTDVSRNIWNSYQSKTMNSFANYVQTCYTNVSEAEGCGSFVKQQLTSHVDRNATCPFEDRICRHQDRNIELDTGYVSLGDLGLNLPPDLRYTLRFINHCAPLAIDGYQEVFNYTDEISYMRYFYGESKVPTRLNFTQEFQIPSVSQIRVESGAAGISDYRLG